MSICATTIQIPSSVFKRWGVKKEYADILREKIQPDKKVKLFYRKGNINNKIMHIRAIVDDEFIVYGVWLKRSKCYDYRITHFYSFYTWLENGHLKF